MNHELSIHRDVIRVIRKVAILRGVTVDEVLSGTRKQEVVTARFISIYICRAVYDYGTHKLAKMFGYGTHTAILHACTKVKHWTESYPSVRSMVQELEASTLMETMNMPANFSRLEDPTIIL